MSDLINFTLIYAQESGKINSIYTEKDVQTIQRLFEWWCEDFFKTEDSFSADDFTIKLSMSQFIKKKIR